MSNEMEYRLSAVEIKQLSDVLADAVAEKVAVKVEARLPKYQCPFEEEVQKELASIGRRSILVRNTVASRLTDFFVYGTLALIVLGFVHWVREKF